MLLIFLVFSLIYFFYLVRIVLLPFIIGIILAYLFNPFIKYMIKKGFSRQGSLVLLLIFIIIIILFSGLVLFPLFISEMEDLAESIPVIITAVEEYIDFMHNEFERLHLPVIIKDSLLKSLVKIENYIVELIQNTTEFIINSLSHVLILFLAPIITYYLLKDITLIKKSFITLFPREERKFYYKLVKGINNIFIGFLRGQVWISIIVGLLGAVGLYFLKVKFYLLLGILTGITNIIPYIGPIIGSLPAVLIACLSTPLKAVAVILLFILIQQIESTLIAPKILSKNVGLHPLTVIFALLAGAELLGIWGLLFAIPVTGSIKVLIRLINEHYAFFNINKQ